MRKVYLSGPMHGLHYEVADSWRQYAKDKLRRYGIDAISPMRGKEALQGKVLFGEYPGVLNCDTFAITQRDRFDVLQSDAMLVYLGDSDEQGGYSAGTLIEIGWADMARKPIIIVTGNSTTGRKLVQHPIVRGTAGWIVDDLDTGIEVVRTMFE